MSTITMLEMDAGYFCSIKNNGVFYYINAKIMKKITLMAAIIPSVILLSVISCSGGKQEGQKPIDIQELTQNQPEVHGTELKESDITISTPLDGVLVKSGNAIYETKCRSCHNLTDVKLVGPGWKGVTLRRKPVWVMNMITNVEMMLEKDPEAQKLLELCMVRMPNQNITVTDARSVLEYMRHNDGVK
jgi:hypothetical protein